VRERGAKGDVPDAATLDGHARPEAPGPRRDERPHPAPRAGVAEGGCMTETQQVREARRAVVQALTARLVAENGEELARLKEQLDETCRAYNTLISTQRQTA